MTAWTTDRQKERLVHGLPEHDYLLTVLITHTVHKIWNTNKLKM